MFKFLSKPRNFEQANTKTASIQSPDKNDGWGAILLPTPPKRDTPTSMNHLPVLAQAAKEAPRQTGLCGIHTSYWPTQKPKQPKIWEGRVHITISWISQGWKWNREHFSPHCFVPAPLVTFSFSSNNSYLHKQRRSAQSSVGVSNTDTN